MRRVPLAFAVILALQVAVPLLRLGSEKPGRFGWHMFAGVPPAVTFAVRYDGSRVDTLTLADVLVRPRPEIDAAAEIPSRLCARDGAVRGVLVLVAGRTDGTEHTCP